MVKDDSIMFIYLDNCSARVNVADVQILVKVTNFRSSGYVKIGSTYTTHDCRHCLLGVGQFTARCSYGKSFSIKILFVPLLEFRCHRETENEELCKFLTHLT